MMLKIKRGAALVALFPDLSGTGQMLKAGAAHLMGIGLWIVLSTVWCALIAAGFVR